MRNDELRFIELSCGHEVAFHLRAMPQVGEYLTCTRCSDAAYVVERDISYQVKCMNCGFARKVELSQVEASRLANVHHRSSPTHEINVIRGSRLWEKRKPNVNSIPELF